MWVRTMKNLFSKADVEWEAERVETDYFKRNSLYDCVDVGSEHNIQCLHVVKKAWAWIDTWRSIGVRFDVFFSWFKVVQIYFTRHSPSTWRQLNHPKQIHYFHGFQAFSTMSILLGSRYSPPHFRWSTKRNIQSGWKYVFRRLWIDSRGLYTLFLKISGCLWHWLLGNEI